MARNTRRHTIYDVMEEKGVFDTNPANTQSNNYKGPIEYPKMLYHPDGETRITQKAEILATPLGPVKVGEHRELLNKVVWNEEEEAEALAEGWHPHPSKSMAAAGLDAPAMAPARRIDDLKRQVAELERAKRELEMLESAQAEENSKKIAKRSSNLLQQKASAA